MRVNLVESGQVVSKLVVNGVEIHGDVVSYSFYPKGSGVWKFHFSDGSTLIATGNVSLLLRPRSKR